MHSGDERLLNARPVALAIVCLVLGAGSARANLSVNLTVAPAAAQFAGSPAVLEASATHSGTEAVVYQFAYRLRRGQWRVLRDFYTWNSFDWVTLDEGDYQLRVTARVPSTGETIEETRSYTVTSPGRLAPVVSQTTHPLVALYSAPACSAGGMRVRYRRQQGTIWQYTPFKACVPGKALNFHVAALRADTNYTVQHQTATSASDIADGPPLLFHSGVTTPPLTGPVVTRLSVAETSLFDSTVLYSFANAPPVATDLSGAITWYYHQPGALLLRPLPGGNMLFSVRDDVAGRVLREIDVAGNVVRETNSTEVSRQLVAMGHDPIGVFHHEAIRLASGHTLVLTSVERIVTDVQGPGPVNVYGEMIVDLDENLRVVWAWNAFDWLDIGRAAVLGETCAPDTPGCPALFLAPTANDWLHANAIGYVAEDGNIIVSLRHQDWIIKIDYHDGAGTGEVLWRLGDGGDFTLISDSSHGVWPWFSHQHDSKMGRGALLVYDNGNTRVTGPNGIGGNSRGQALLLDEVARTATLVLNLDLGAYSEALGSAQRLLNGNFFFGNGLLGDFLNPFSEAVELGADGVTTFAVRANAFVYRALRMKDIYRP